MFLGEHALISAHSASTRVVQPGFQQVFSTMKTAGSCSDLPFKAWYARCSAHTLAAAFSLGVWPVPHVCRPEPVVLMQPRFLFLVHGMHAFLLVIATLGNKNNQND